MAVAARPALVLPGLKPVDRSLETHWVRPGAATAVPLHPDDRITIVNRDGGQVAELTVVDSEGGEDAAALGARADVDATVLRDLVRAGSADGFLAELHAGGLVPDDARALRLFDNETPRDAAEEFVAEREAIAIVAAPGGRVVEGDWPASPLLIEVRRAIPRELEEVELPAPLAEPRLDFRVDRASAAAYEVKEGEYIQIIDVQGKQCSDFLAFNRDKLEDGSERGLDATTTRSLMGSAYPQPGLYRKSFDVDMDPLVEVVQDTVGRHDSFALACNAKYYEDLGYFGHTNCSDNFNGEVTPYGVAARKGWEALNFFYNTAFDDDNRLMADEPWSRPGDFVLLRAANDLLCASSACPDDIDPANGWEITDIHVRVYRPENRFSLAIAHRVTPEADPVMTKETGFHPRTSDLTRDFVEYRGYWLPDCFEGEGTIAEYWACRERAAIMDLSPLRKWEVVGPDAELLMQRAITRDARKLSVGQVTYTAVCNETGGMLDDATVYRLADDNFRFVTGDEYTGVHLRELAEAESLRAWVKQSTDELHNVAVQGPASREILRRRRLDAADAAGAGRAALVPLPDRSGRRLRRDPDRRLAHGLHGRARLRGLVPSRRRPGRLGRDLAGRRAPRPDAARALGARHAADRVGADLRRLRVRRPGRPVRGRDRVRRRARRRGRLRRQGGADRTQGASRSASSSGSSSRATRSPATATASTSRARARRSA